ncbi:zinc-binding dehydrogenase [Rhodococcus wratislaviensis]|uniref:zinc-binding dehydrogenase n=1 Tax=Rhodococcus wratislaviensis TaxID=44752 RepID=UPI003519066D
MIPALTPDVVPAVADGRVRPAVDSVLSFDQAKKAADRLRSNQSRGKIVLTFVWVGQRPSTPDATTTAVGELAAEHHDFREGTRGSQSSIARLQRRHCRRIV